RKNGMGRDGEVISVVYDENRNLMNNPSRNVTGVYVSQDMPEGKYWLRLQDYNDVQHGAGASGEMRRYIGEFLKNKFEGMTPGERENYVGSLKDFHYLFSRKYGQTTHTANAYIEDENGNRLAGPFQNLYYMPNTVDTLPVEIREEASILFDDVLLRQCVIGKDADYANLVSLSVNAHVYHNHLSHMEKEQQGKAIDQKIVAGETGPDIDDFMMTYEFDKAPASSMADSIVEYVGEIRAGPKQAAEDMSRLMEYGFRALEEAKGGKDTADFYFEHRDEIDQLKQSLAGIAADAGYERWWKEKQFDTPRDVYGTLYVTNEMMNKTNALLDAHGRYAGLIQKINAGETPREFQARIDFALERISFGPTHGLEGVDFSSPAVDDYIQQNEVYLSRKIMENEVFASDSNGAPVVLTASGDIASNPLYNYETWVDYKALLVVNRKAAELREKTKQQMARPVAEITDDPLGQLAIHNYREQLGKDFEYQFHKLDGGTLFLPSLGDKFAPDDFINTSRIITITDEDADIASQDDFREAIDTLSGISVNNKEAAFDAEAKIRRYAAGLEKMTGEEALEAVSVWKASNVLAKEADEAMSSLVRKSQQAIAAKLERERQERAARLQEAAARRMESLSGRQKLAEEKLQERGLSLSMLDTVAGTSQAIEQRVAGEILAAKYPVEDVAWDDLNIVMSPHSEKALKKADEILYNIGPLSGEDFINAAYNYIDPETGLEAKLLSMGVSTSGKSVVIHGEIYDGELRAGTFTRTLTENGTMEHDLFDLKAEYQKGGFGRRFYEHSEGIYIQAGIEYVTLHAGLSIGGYSWARMGFQADPTDIDRFIDIARKEWEKVSEFKFPTVTNWTMSKIAALRAPEGNNVGFETLAGRSWYGIKHLDVDNESFQDGLLYYAAKRESEVLKEALFTGLKGGPGSGHHGHAGRPGKHGGSLPGDVAMSRQTGRAGTERKIIRKITAINRKYIRRIQGIIKRRGDVTELRRAFVSAQDEYQEYRNDVERGHRRMLTLLTDDIMSGEALAKMGPYATPAKPLAEQKYMPTSVEYNLSLIAYQGLQTDNPYEVDISMNLPDPSHGPFYANKINRLLGIVPKDQVNEEMSNPFLGDRPGFDLSEKLTVEGAAIRPGYNGYYTHISDSIAFNAGSGFMQESKNQTLIHEVGHWLSARIPGALRACNKDYDYRTANGIRLTDIAGFDYLSEGGYFDNYMAKLASHDAPNRGCEIFSVVCESLETGMIGRVAKDDPASFDLVLSYLTGLPSREAELRANLAEVLKGGPGSGHHGHAGIPGHHGGSLPADVAMSREGRDKWFKALGERGKRIAAKWARRIRDARLMGATTDEIRQLFLKGDTELSEVFIKNGLDTIHALVGEIRTVEDPLTGLMLDVADESVIQSKSFFDGTYRARSADILLDGLALGKHYEIDAEIEVYGYEKERDVQEAINRLFKIVPPGVVDDQMPNPFDNAGRSEYLSIEDTSPMRPYTAYNLDEDDITIGDNFPEFTSNTAHELGHWLTARIPGAAENFHGLFEKRTAFPSVRYSTQNYEYYDEFPADYMGRIYGSMSFQGLEIPSVGIEMIFKGDGRALAEDAEIFNLILSTFTGIPMRGEYRQGAFSWILKSLRLKGGPGSGHHGHAGRPGKHGGSLPGDVAMSIRTGLAGTERKVKGKVAAISRKYIKKLQAAVKRKADVSEIRGLIVASTIELEAYQEKLRIQRYAMVDALQNDLSTDTGKYSAENVRISMLQGYGQFFENVGAPVSNIVYEGLKVDNSYSPEIRFFTSEEGRKYEANVRRILGIVPENVIDETIPNPFLSAEAFIGHPTIGRSSALRFSESTSSYYDSEDDSIAISLNKHDYFVDTAVVHETGHWLSARIPGALDAVRAEWKRRTKGATIQKDRYGSYKFLDGGFYDKYMGRVYQTLGDRRNGTEIFSEVCESIEKGTIGWLGEKDPQSFDLVMSYLTGLPRGGGVLKGKETGDMDDIVKLKETIAQALKGGAGSGHYGHEGVAGQVGGSAPSGVAQPQAAAAAPAAQAAAPVGGGGMYKPAGQRALYQAPKRGKTQFNEDEWEALPMPERLAKWNSLSEEERDSLANARTTVPDEIAKIVNQMGERPAFDGKNVRKAIRERMSQSGELLHGVAKDKIGKHVETLDG
ncbi:MAG: hypothetical protein M0R06_13980, partial [Sphaerochaeta sp.]|nr:hypothetical protein [Sphaerochaeta sp.]